MESYYNANPSDRRNCQNQGNRNCRPPVNNGCSTCQNRDYPIKSGCESCNGSRPPQRPMRPEPQQRNQNCTNHCSNHYPQSANRQGMNSTMMRNNCQCSNNEKRCNKQDPMEQLGCRFPVVMAYVPWQQWGNLYEPDCALREGTLFKDLNFIFCGVRC